jgi:hypothetical protein
MVARSRFGCGRSTIVAYLRVRETTGEGALVKDEWEVYSSANPPCDPEEWGFQR